MARSQFLFGAVIIVASVGLMFQGVKETGVYFLTRTFRREDDRGSDVLQMGLKMPAWCRIAHRTRPPRRSIFRSPTARNIRSRIGLVRDTFTDANDIEVVVEGRPGRTASSTPPMSAKCGSRMKPSPKPDLR
jgi:hypothetical protein